MRLRIKRGVQHIAKDDSTPHVNEQIKALQVRLVGPDGNQMGIVPVKEALDAAEEEG
ncbi:hypothetical protein ACFL6Q_05030, partial [Candidatus Neomarinimicrobiota bacterium]